MSFWYTFCSNLFGIGISLIFMLWTSALLLGKKPQNRQGIAGMLAVIVFFLVVFAALGAAFYRFGLFRWKYNAGRILFYYLVFPLEMLLLRALYRERCLVCWVLALLMEMIDSFASNAGFLFSRYEIFDLGVPGQRVLYYLFSWGLAPLFQTAVILLLYKTKFCRLFRNWISLKTIHSVPILFLSLYPIWEEVLYWMIRLGQRVDENMMLSLLYFIVIGIVFYFMWLEELRKKEIDEQKMNLQQQKSYIQNLEGMQKEMRRFRHDFKNMMSGMYLQAKEGDLEAVQAFIQDMTTDFDSQVGSRIRQMTQLGNIHMTEVKGLLLGKLDEMQRGQISCELEVLRPFYGTGMRVTDLCRCLGILIDNAMDEVRGQKKPLVSVLISSQEGCTTFRIKNRLYSTVDFHKIWTQGYSTRGADRGVGLASYRAILERYDNVMPHTSIRDGCFIQELKVQQGKGGY